MTLGGHASSGCSNESHDVPASWWWWWWCNVDDGHVDDGDDNDGDDDYILVMDDAGNVAEMMSHLHWSLADCWFVVKILCHDLEFEFDFS